MVRKRSKGSKRHFESEEEPETESEFEDDPAYEPAPKKYSLRQRKKTTFTSDDFEYEEDTFDAPTRKEHSEDEDFEVKNKEGEDVENSTQNASVETTTEVQEELVDFEDMIRADIVVNKNRIDYDNIIQKTEIKLQPHSESYLSEMEKKGQAKQSKQPPKPKGKRGRKPKRRNSEINEPQFLAPQIQDSENDEDYHPYKPKRTRKPKSRPAGEIDSSILEDIDDYDFEDRNDEDYNPDDDLDYPGLSNYILDKQISADIENIPDSDIRSETNETLQNIETTESTSTAPPIADSTACEPVVETNPSVTETSTKDVEAPTATTDLDSEATTNVSDDVTSATVPDTTSVSINPDTTEPDQIFESTSNASNEFTDATIEEAPDQEEEKSDTLEKVSSSSSHTSVIKVNETVVNSDLHVNGSVKHIKSPEESHVNIPKEDDDDDDDDDIVFIEEEKNVKLSF